jgi:hypothetical protein
MADWSGQCLCGAIRYSAKASPFWQAHCHCQSCRQATGAAFASFFGLSKAAIAWVGQRAFHRSSPGVTRGFCAACGTAMSYQCTRWPGEVHLYAGTLDTPAVYQTTAHVHWAERVPWITVADDLPKIPGLAAPNALSQT